MPTSPVRSLIDHIRTAVPPEGDGELLGHFVDRRDERAMAALVDRHGPMVWGVCRRLLSHHDAEDAFQATFIVLVRKAGSIRPREMVGNWLFGVARQAALQARVAARRRERQVAQMPDTAAPQDRWADVRPILDEELSRLPDHYRTVIVLSDLEGRTRKEVAAQLGCPEGTVASRLVRARSMLAKRLTQRGVALSGGALAVVLSQSTGSAGVPAAVVSSTIKAASLCTAGKAMMPVNVAALAEGVLKAMLMSKLKAIVAVVLVLGFLAIGAIGVGVASAQQRGEPVEQPKAQKVEGGAVKEKAAEAVVKEKADTKEAVAWGKEVDGLQVGLVADAEAIRQGEKLKLTVKLRNVGKAEVTITYRLLQECAPQVTNGGKVSVFMPAPKDYYAVPKKRAIKTGETITLYKPEVAVEPEALMRLEGIVGVETPTICVDPGKYKISYGGMIQSHPKLATETVEFEVKEPVKPPEMVFAWGTEVDGLQAGIGVEAKRVYRVEEPVQLTVKLRNPTEAPISYSYLPAPLHSATPTVRDAAGKVVPVLQSRFGAPSISPVKGTLKAGEEITFDHAVLQLEPPGRTGDSSGNILRVTPGKYTVGYAKLLQSHPTLVTGFAEFEVKDDIAWGKELGGLQAGIVGPGSIRIGEKARFVVKLRNVSKETVKVSAWPLWMNYPGVVDARGDRVRTTVAPTPLFEIIPKALTLKPGETVDVGRSDLIVAEPDHKVAVADGVVDMCAIHVKPGMYKADCMGFLKDNHLLGTGTVEFEVKPAEVTTAWGKELGGLQAGLSAQKRTYSLGETAKLVVRVRNVTKEAVKFRYVRQFFLENPPTVTDSKGKSVPLERITVYGFHALVPANLAPGEEIEVGERQLELKPVLYATGKYGVQYERLETPANDKTLSELATGKLELEVKESPPAKSEGEQGRASKSEYPTADIVVQYRDESGRDLKQFRVEDADAVAKLASHFPGILGDRGSGPRTSEGTGTTLTVKFNHKSGEASQMRVAHVTPDYVAWRWRDNTPHTGDRQVEKKDELQGLMEKLAAKAKVNLK